MKLQFFLSLLFIHCLFLPSAQANEQIIIKFSHVSSSDSPKGKAANYFAKLAAERTNHQVRVVVYPDSQLFKDKEEFEALQLGTVQMLAPSLAKFSSLGMKEFELFDLPYLFDSYDELHRVTRGPVGQMIFEKLKKRGVIGLAYWDNGFKSFSANHPLRMPRDYQGLTFRIQSSKVLAESILALKAQPRVIAFSDARQMLATGMVHATENPISNFYSSKMYEVQPHLTLSNHGYLGYAVVVNKKFWESLPAKIRHQLESALSDATSYANQNAAQDQQASLQKIKASGLVTIHQLSPQEKTALREVLLPVHRKMERHIGSSLMRAVYKEVNFKAE